MKLFVNVCAIKPVAFKAGKETTRVKLLVHFNTFMGFISVIDWV